MMPDYTVVLIDAKNINQAGKFEEYIKRIVKDYPRILGAIKFEKFRNDNLSKMVENSARIKTQYQKILDLTYEFKYFSSDEIIKKLLKICEDDLKNE